jgi:hypothetical protein
MTEDPFELIPEEQKFEEVNFDNISGVLEEIKDSGDKVLFILDDVIADIRGKGKGAIENLLQKIFFNRRHLAGAGGSVSILATSQTYNKIDPKLRKTASQCVWYKNQNKKEQDSIFEEMILIPRREYEEVKKYIYAKKHDFLYLDTTLADNQQIHKNFNPLIIRSPNIASD